MLIFAAGHMYKHTTFAQTLAQYDEVNHSKQKFSHDMGLHVAPTSFRGWEPSTLKLHEPSLQTMVFNRQGEQRPLVTYKPRRQENYQLF